MKNSLTYLRLVDRFLEMQEKFEEDLEGREDSGSHFEDLAFLLEEFFLEHGEIDRRFL